MFKYINVCSSFMLELHVNVCSSGMLEYIIYLYIYCMHICVSASCCIGYMYNVGDC